MRIRTIKPEFWAHPVMGRLRGEFQALAIGLLNHADDHGYFLADPASVRSALRPFDDTSSAVREGLEELVRAGWIEVHHHPTHGPVGMVVNFDKHQRVDRKNPSNLKQYFDDGALDDDSTNDRRTIDERSTPEGKGREGKGTGSREGKGSGKAPQTKLKNQKSPPVQAELPAVPPAPPPEPPKPSWQREAYLDWTYAREEYLERAGLPVDPEPEPHPAHINATYARLVGDLEPERRLNWLGLRAEWFLQQPWGAFKDGKPRDPPWPWQMLVSEKVWNQANAAIEAEIDREMAEEAWS